jgi:cystathionine beta-lyase family protein involved in aluminum resistance
MGSLKDFGIEYDEVHLKNERLDYEAIEAAVDSSVTMVYIQRSRGYELRPSLLVKEIEKVVQIAKKKNPSVIVMVDNCYGEFVEKIDQPMSVLIL